MKSDEFGYRFKLAEVGQHNELLELRLKNLGTELVETKKEVESLRDALVKEKLLAKQIMARMYISLRKQTDIESGEIKAPALYNCPQRSKNGVRCALIDRHEKEHISEDGDHWWG